MEFSDGAIDALTADGLDKTGARKLRRKPTLEVRITTVLLKLTRRPLLSVRIPSSIIWSRILLTSLCAFSISSKRITELGQIARKMLAGLCRRAEAMEISVEFSDGAIDALTADYALVPEKLSAYCV